MSTLKLTNDQNNASAAFTSFLLDDNEKFFVISGGAGSGKSTLLKHLLDTLEDKYKMVNMLKQRNQKCLTVALTATTNKAVAVLKEMGNAEPTTIHSFLKLTLKPNFKTGKTQLVKTKKTQKISNHLIVIDEASMIDFIDPDGAMTLYDFIEELVDDSCKIVLVGDQFQLAPVNHSTTLMETLSCDKAELNQILRNTGIIKATGQQFKDTVKTGKFNPIIADGCDLQQVDGPTFQRLMDQAFTDEHYTSHTAKVLAWTNARVIAYNDHIRKLKGYGSSITAGETVVTTKPIIGRGYNIPIDSDVYIKDIEPETKERNVAGCYVTLGSGHTAFLPNSQVEAKALLKRYAKKKDWMEYFSVKDSWLDLRPNYASSTHKAQGSTYETVFIDMINIGKCRVPSDVARMCYVAITRASKQVIIYGDLPPKYRG